MKTLNLAILLFLTLSGFSQKSDQEMINDLYTEVLTNSPAYEWLDQLANGIGGRLAGSPEAAAAVEWSFQLMKTIGFDTVYLQPCMVPHWVRGEKEYGKIVNSKLIGEQEVNLCALGGSVGTKPEGLTARVVEVTSKDHLDKLGKRGLLKGKIAFINVPMNQANVTTFKSYSETVGYRYNGAKWASEYGAVGMILRSIGSVIDDHPHTGVMSYGDNPKLKKIPAAAISTRDAETLSRIMKNDPLISFHLKMSCETFEDKLSHNVIGEIRGQDIPDEYILVGGHLDAWDNGDGAHDDGSGCVQSIEVARSFLALGHKPKRTIRVVMFMNEENGLAGGLEYARLAKVNEERHIAALESDAGGFTPRGFGMTGSDEAYRQLKSYLPLFPDYTISEIQTGGGGADIGPLKEQGTVVIGLHPDSQRYFEYHHAAIDKFEAINKRELNLGAASMAGLIYLLDQHGIGASMR